MNKSERTNQLANGIFALRAPYYPSMLDPASRHGYVVRIESDQHPSFLRSEPNLLDIRESATTYLVHASCIHAFQL